jgi:hypothetical protein
MACTAAAAAAAAALAAAAAEFAASTAALAAFAAADRVVLGLELAANESAASALLFSMHMPNENMMYAPKAAGLVAVNLSVLRVFKLFKPISIGLY